MSDTVKVLKCLQTGQLDEKLLDIYVDGNGLSYQRERYMNAVKVYEDIFGAEEISIYRSTKKNSGYKKVATLNHDNLVKYGWDLDKSFNWVYKYDDKNLKSETTYYYKVRGYYIQDNNEKEAFYGPYSSVKAVKTSSNSNSSSTNNAKGTTYTIIYNSNSGTGTMINQNIEYSKSTKLSDNKFSKSGYIFAGWKAKRKNGTYTAGERLSITNISYNNPVEEDFYKSHVWNKTKLILLIH